MKGTVSRKDISLEEEVEYIHTLPDAEPWTAWAARFDGPVSTGENLTLTRTADHADDALALLEEALKELGLELR